MNDRIRVLIADDHFIVRLGLTASINAESDMTVVAEADSGRQAIELHRQHQPDVTLMDLRMPKVSGAEAIAAIRREFPHSRIIAISNHDDAEDVDQALRAGACGYLAKDARREEMLAAIRGARLGRWNGVTRD